SVRKLFYLRFPLSKISKVFTRRRVCLRAPAAALPVQNVDCHSTPYSHLPQRLSLQPIAPSSPLPVRHGVPVRDSVFSSACWHCLVSSRRLLAPKTSLRLTQ